MGEIQVDLEKSNRRPLPVRTTSRIVQELEAKQVWQVPLALLWTCEECQNRNVPRNRHCGSREAPNEKKNKPAKEQWKFLVDPTSEPSWSDVALYEKDLHRKNARSIMTPQPNMSTTSEASTTRWKRSQSRRAKKRWRRRTLTCTWSQSIQRSVCDVGKEMVMRMQIKRSFFRRPCFHNGSIEKQYKENLEHSPLSSHLIIYFTLIHIVNQILCQDLQCLQKIYLRDTRRLHEHTVRYIRMGRKAKHS